MTVPISDPESSRNDSIPGPHNPQGVDPICLATTQITAPVRDQQIEVFSRSNLPNARMIAELSESFTRVYGDGYQFDELENPELYIAGHRSGNWFSIIVKNTEGAPLGHASVIKKSEGVYELGRLFIDPAAQGNGIGRILTNAQMDIVEELRAAGVLKVVVAEPVTSHQSSQKLYAPYGFTTTGFFDRRYTDFFSMGYRESVVRLSGIYSDDIKEKREVFLPASLHPIAQRIYSELGCVREIQNANDAPRDRTRSSAIKQCHHEFDAFGIVSLEPGSARSPLTVVSDTGSEFANGAHYVEVRIDIQHPDCLGQINALRLAGFYFAALEAHPEGDYLLMQRLHPTYPRQVNPHIDTFLSPYADRLVQSLEDTRWPP